MLTLMRIHAVEILSMVMGLWLVWIIITYTNYFKELKNAPFSNSLVPSEDLILQKARDKRKKAYDIAVTYPSYAIFWVTVLIWGISYLLRNTST